VRTGRRVKTGREASFYEKHGFKRLFAIAGRCDGLIATDSVLSPGAAPLDVMPVVAASHVGGVHRFGEASLFHSSASERSFVRSVLYVGYWTKRLLQTALSTEKVLRKSAHSSLCDAKSKTAPTTFF
jgi:hypothetical protein